MYVKIFETALGIEAPWSVKSVQFQQADPRLIILIDFAPGTRFAVPGVEGMHPVHDTVSKDYRHLNFFEHQCLLRVRTPRVKLPAAGVRLIEPAVAGRLTGFTLLYEALILMLAQQMPFTAVARIAGESAYRVQRLCDRYVELALAQADFSEVSSLAIDETSQAREHQYVTLAADAKERRVIFVAPGRAAETIQALAADLQAHKGAPRLTMTARAWVYKERLSEILDRKQINVVREALHRWTCCVMRSKVSPMKEVAQMVRRHFEGIVAWAQTRQSNDFLEAINGLFQAATRRARGFGRFSTIRTVIFLIAGKLNFSGVNHHFPLPTRI